jgi:hypothetical protein
MAFSQLLNAIMRYQILLLSILIFSCYQQNQNNNSEIEDKTEQLETQVPIQPFDFNLVDLDSIKNDLSTNKTESKYFEYNYIFNFNLLDTTFSQFMINVDPGFMDSLNFKEIDREEFSQNSDKVLRSYIKQRGRKIPSACHELLEVFRDEQCRTSLISEIVGTGYELKNHSVNYVIYNGNKACINMSGPTWTFDYMIELWNNEISILQLAGMYFEPSLEHEELGPTTSSSSR